ncbi:hypothetical protein D3C76_1633020 [compost metagenome]
MLACLQCSNGKFGMCIIPGTDTDSIHMRVLQHLPIIGVHGLGIILLRSSLSPFFVQIADGIDDGILVFGITPHMKIRN